MLAFIVLGIGLVMGCGDDSNAGGQGAATGGSTQAPKSATTSVASSVAVTSTVAGSTSTGNAICDLPDVYCDAGLMWQVAIAGQEGTKTSASHTCSMLTLAGNTDWRLPTISELRTLIRGCLENEPGGPCGVTSTCTDFDCKNGCLACPFGQGIGVAGCYWPAEFPKDMSPCGASWSSDDVVDPLGGEPATWGIDFLFAQLVDENPANELLTRCVRSL